MDSKVISSAKKWGWSILDKYTPLRAAIWNIYGTYLFPHCHVFSHLHSQIVDHTLRHCDCISGMVQHSHDHNHPNDSHNIPGIDRQNMAKSIMSCRLSHRSIEIVAWVPADCLLHSIPFYFCHDVMCNCIHRSPWFGPISLYDHFPSPSKSRPKTTRANTKPIVSRECNNTRVEGCGCVSDGPKMSQNVPKTQDVFAVDSWDDGRGWAIQDIQTITKNCW